MPAITTDLNIALLAPELALAVVALVVIGLDLVLPAERKSLLAYLGVLGLIAAGALAVGLGGSTQVGYAGTWIVDPVAIFFKLLFLIAAAFVLLSSIDYIRRRTDYQGEYYAVLLFATTGMLMMASARELITLYLALELTSISLYVLAGFLKGEKTSAEAGIKYLVLGAVSSAALLYGMALTFGLTGTTVLPDIARQIAANRVETSPLLMVALVLVAAGFGFKVAAVPFHLWVPDVYQGAPTPVTAFLSVASKASGFVILLRVFTVAFAGLTPVWAGLFAVLAAVTMTVGNVGALRQTNVKRLMGYSSIGQAGYALMAFAAFLPGQSPAVNSATAATNSATVSALLFFLLAYALTNLAVFAAIIHVSNRLGSDELADYAGLSGRAPVLSLALLLGLLSLVGLPPMVGFWSKIYLFYSVFNAGVIWLVVVALLNSALAASYYLRIIHAMYLRPAPVDKPLAADAPLGLALAASVIAVVVLGLLPSPVFQAAASAAANLRP
ncbi:MAG: NADH-quinone oxidoreductase subunit N [Chloroflexi bacterium]|nr:NADH-quinone oxidoreductase subunit N [Chloroflexota bacterium]